MNKPLMPEGKRGGTRPGAGRPKAPERPIPVSWRPDTQAQRDKWLELGGARWIKRILQEMLDRTVPDQTGAGYYRGGSEGDVSNLLSQMGYGNPQEASAALREAGIPGIRYLDAGSRGNVDVNELRGTVSMWKTAVNKTPNDDYAWKMLEESEAALKQAESGGSRNYVIFDENLINIVRKYGIAGAAAMLGMSQADVAQAMGQQPQGLLESGPQ